MPSSNVNWGLMLPVIALNVANSVAFCDLLGISAILSEVSEKFGTVGAIEWATTATLIGATVGQCLLGYLSDVWSRRNMLLFALSLLLVSTIATSCIFETRSQIAFVLLRAFAGVAVGSISNLVNIAQNDIATKEQRLKLQAVQGVSVAAGSILGMMVGAVFAEQHKAHQLYYVEAGFTAVALVLVAAFVKAQRKSTESFRSVTRKIDYSGILSGIAFIVPGLILMSNFSKLQRNIIGILGALTGIGLLVYLYIGFRNPFNSRPLVPFELFRNRTLAAIYVQNILFGAAYYTFIYFLPVYLMVVRQIPAVQASAMMIAYFILHGAWSAGSARVVLWLQKKGHRSYSTILLQGFLLWTPAAGFIAAGASSKTEPPIAVIIALAGFVGLGTGAVFQNSVLAIREQVSNEQNAVALGVRNVLRYLGGAIGTAISSIIMTQTLTSKIPEDLKEFRVHTISRKHVHDLDPEQRDVVRAGFGAGITWVFTASAAFLAVCTILCLLIRDQPKEVDNEKAMDGTSMTSSEVSLSSPDAVARPTPKRVDSGAEMVCPHC